MPASTSLTLCAFVALILTPFVVHTNTSLLEGQLDIPDITQIEEKPGSTIRKDGTLETSQPEEQMAMKGVFSQTGQILGFGLNVNNGSLLCPSNSCEFTIENGMLSRDYEGYTLEGKLRVTEKEDKNSTWYEVEANLKEPWNKQPDREPDKKFMTGFLFTSSVEGDESPHYYIYNGTLVINPDNSTLILQGRDY